MKIKILFILTLLCISGLLVSEEKPEAKGKKSGDYIVTEDGSLMKLEDARRQARREADKLHRYNFKYYAGEYLIYDCRSRYFACVDQSSYDYCKLARKKTKVEGYAILGCAPLKKFKSLTDCLMDQYKVIHKMPSKLFCINREKASAYRKEAFSEITKTEQKEKKEEVEKIPTVIIESK